jgi:hypothetical protein
MSTTVPGGAASGAMGCSGGIGRNMWLVNCFW